MRIALLGFGLIGGSVARALRAGEADPANPAWTITAWSPSGAGPARAAAEGVVDRAAASASEAVEGAELVVLAAPPVQCMALLDDLAGPLAGSVRAGAVVTDVASTKTAIVEHAAGLGLRFVGGHPMAGRETTGYASASGDLFVGRPWVVVPSDDARAEAAVVSLAIACGAMPIALAPGEHDAAVAAISHLPLILSAALVEAVIGMGEAGDRPDWSTARALAAGGWESMTRLARGDARMGAGIVATNAGPLAGRIRDVRAVLDEWLAELERPEGPDPGAVLARLREARRRAGGA